MESYHLMGIEFWFCKIKTFGRWMAVMVARHCDEADIQCGWASSNQLKAFIGKRLISLKKREFCQQTAFGPDF